MEALIYQFNLYQDITNKKQVSNFILNNNTEAARAIKIAQKKSQFQRMKSLLVLVN